MPCAVWCRDWDCPVVKLLLRCSQCESKMQTVLLFFRAREALDSITVFSLLLAYEYYRGSLQDWVFFLISTRFYWFLELRLLINSRFINRVGIVCFKAIPLSSHLWKCRVRAKLGCAASMGFSRKHCVFGVLSVTVTVTGPESVALWQPCPEQSRGIYLRKQDRKLTSWLWHTLFLLFINEQVIIRPLPVM